MSTTNPHPVITFVVRGQALPPEGPTRGSGLTAASTGGRGTVLQRVQVGARRGSSDEVRVAARQSERGLELEVTDTGVGCESEPEAGFGLAQVRERLHTAFGPSARCDWHSAPGQGTRVTLHLPLNGARQP